VTCSNLGLRGLLVFAAVSLSLGAPGCGPENPNANVEAPVITDDAPKNSEEAAARSEPPPQKQKSRGR
jgi:hypothetical protein